MKKLTLTLSAAGLAAAAIGMASPATADPFSYQDPCTVHVLHQGSLVDVKWC